MNIFERLSIILTDFTPVRVFPILTGFFLLFFFIYYIKILHPYQGTIEWVHMEVHTERLTFFNRRYPMARSDIVPLVLISFVFLFFAVYNLGETTAVDVLHEIHYPPEDRTHINHLNNMYFDEIYFVRTAVEHIENVNPFEVSHPPLGKEIIAASILMFGMSPFGWRLTGAVFGVLMLIVMYVFIKNMFGKTIVAVCGTLLLGFDFMRFVQTRIGTIDTYVVFFILLSFFFMYRYVTTNPDAPFRKSLLPLALSGFFFGLSIAVKWTGFYAGAGLLVIYVIYLFQLGFHYSSNNKRDFDIYLTKTLLFSIIFFVIIPSIVYYLTYIPYGLARGMTLGDGMLLSPEFFNVVWGNQIAMFSYHSQLEATHPFSSVWWQWILNIRPILYVANMSGDARATFGAFGNPVVWWGGFLAMVTMALRVFTHRDGKALFILIGFLAQLLPWVAVTRILFIYHYFPSTIFLVLALAHIFNTEIERHNERSGRAVIYAYTIISGFVFALFYPVLSGHYMPNWYYNTFIKWFSTWPF